MSTTGNLQFPIPNAVLEPYIQQAVSTAIIAALGDGSKLVEQAVHHALSTKVSRDGTVSTRYESDNRYQLVEVVASNKIRDIAKDTILRMAESMRPQIVQEVEKYLKKQHGALARMLVDELIKGLSCSWTLTVNVKGDGE